MRRSRPDSGRAPSRDHAASQTALPRADLIAALRAARAFVATLTGAGVSAESGRADVSRRADGPVGAASTRASSQRRPRSRATPSSSGTGTHGVASVSRRPSPTPDIARSPSWSGACRSSCSSRRTSTGCTSAPAAASSSSCTATSAASSARARARSSSAGTSRGRRSCRAARIAARCLRPDVVWFEETLPERALARGRRRGAALRRAARRRHVGGGLPGSRCCRLIAREHGALVVEVNPNPTPLTSHADYVLRGAAGEMLPRLVESESR